MSATSYKEAKESFLSNDFASSETFFKENNFMLEYGYCKLLSGKADDAKLIFKGLADIDLRADWAEKLIQFIEGYVPNVPTYFQIRNFLEIDLNLLVNSGQPEYVENIINGADLFFSANPESYKFIARVMFNNGYDELAFYFLKKAEEKFYYDPELHLMLANCYLKNGEKLLAKKALNNCLRILPDYFPAKKLLEKIKG